MCTKEKTSITPKVTSDEELLRQLVLFNDEVNTFDDVIEALVMVCNHDLLQAENCALIAHHKGKCVVKKGSLSVLNPMKTALGLRDLTVVIN